MEVCKATPRSKLADGYPTTKRKKEKKGNTNKQALRVLRGDPLWMSVTSVNEFGSCEVLCLTQLSSKGCIWIHQVFFRGKNVI